VSCNKLESGATDLPCGSQCMA